MAVPFAVYAGLAGYQIYSGMQQAAAMRRQAEMQRKIDEENAKLAEVDMWQAEAFGQTQMAEYQKTIDQTQASTIVSAAAAGIKVEGSLRDVAQENQFNGFLNQLAIQNQAQERALGYKRQAAGIRGQSALNYNSAISKAGAVQTASLIQGLDTGITGYAKTKTAKVASTTPNAGVGYDGDTSAAYSDPYSLG